MVIEIMRKIRGYSSSQIALHWASAVVILFLLLPISRDDAPQADAVGPVAVSIILHVSAGLSILPLLAARLALRFRRGVPPPEAMEPELLCGAGRLAHRSMYLCLLVLPVSGACYWFGGLGGGHVVHEIARVLLTGLMGLHVVGALTHHFVFRTSVLTRMCRPER